MSSDFPAEMSDTLSVKQLQRCCKLLKVLHLRMNRWYRMVANMQVTLTQCKHFIQAVAPSGNLFLLATLQELRWQGLTYTAFYILQRCSGTSVISESMLRFETGLEDYEISRACKFLARNEMIAISAGLQDRRVRVLRRTTRGAKIHGQILSAAAKRLKRRLDSLGEYEAVVEKRRLLNATESFRGTNQILLGPVQISFFDTHPEAMEPEAL